MSGARQANLYLGASNSFEIITDSASLREACQDAWPYIRRFFNASASAESGDWIFYREVRSVGVVFRISRPRASLLSMALVGQAVMVQDVAAAEASSLLLDELRVPTKRGSLSDMFRQEGSLLAKKLFGLGETSDRQTASRPAGRPPKSEPPLRNDWLEACKKVRDEMRRDPLSRDVTIIGGDGESRLRVGVGLLSLLRDALTSPEKGGPDIGFSTRGPSDGDLGTNYTIFLSGRAPSSRPGMRVVDLRPTFPGLRADARRPQPYSRPEGRTPPEPTPPMSAERAPQVVPTHPGDRKTSTRATDPANPPPQSEHGVQQPVVPEAVRGGDGVEPAHISQPPPQTSARTGAGEGPISEPALVAISDAAIKELLQLAERVWREMSSPAPLILALQDCLGPADGREVCRVFDAISKQESAAVEARAILLGGIHAAFGAHLSSDPDRASVVDNLIKPWPAVAQVFYLNRLLRGRARSEEFSTAIMQAITTLIEVCSSADTEGVPAGMRLGFLQAISGSDRMPDDVRDTALRSADEILCSGDGVPPSVLVRVLVRSASETQVEDLGEWVVAAIARAGVAPCLVDKRLVRLAALTLYVETGVAPRIAYEALRGAAEVAPEWRKDAPAHLAFLLAETEYFRINVDSKYIEMFSKK